MKKTNHEIPANGVYFTRPAPSYAGLYGPKPEAPQYAPMPETPQYPAAAARVVLILTKLGGAEERVYNAELAEQLILGRSVKADLTLKGDDALSLRHMAFNRETDGVFLVDLGSTNGTFINGAPIFEPKRLNDGDIVMAGSVSLRVNLEYF